MQACRPVSRSNRYDRLAGLPVFLQKSSNWEVPSDCLPAHMCTAPNDSNLDAGAHASGAVDRRRLIQQGIPCIYVYTLGRC